MKEPTMATRGPASLRLPLGTVGIQTVRTAAMVRGLDPQSPEALATMVMELCINDIAAVREAAQQIRQAKVERSET